jgi:hypothetical protein
MISLNVFLKHVSRPTKLALDAEDSAGISGSFLASSFLCSQTESVTQTVGKQKVVLVVYL